ncbi:hypothetical protein CXB51_029285 [Gossypium anomalum]|uniref:DUF4283 domain-containing protein n=1 Tax=Gossypium anomalum TaxID=47600 RepID=A0A8J6CLL4_9ROSI|nr:hypothetical protein CXB51_029285 [Gossypium anomalum]
MEKGTPISQHLDTFNYIILDLKNIDIKIDDEDRSLIVLCSLSHSYENFVDTMLYNHGDISLKEVKNDLGCRIRVKIARFKGRREIWRRATMQRKTLVIKETKHKGVEDVTRRKEAEEELEEAWKANTLERSIEDESSARESNKIKVVQGHVEDELLWKLQKCLVGEVASFCETKSLAERIARMGLGKICVKRIRGNYFLIEILDEELLNILKQREWSYLKEFFIHIKLWSENMVFSERVTWTEISRVPMHCWNYKMFKRVAGKWGTLVSMGENLSGTMNFEKIEMLISITQLKR